MDCHFINIYFGETVIENTLFINCEFTNTEFYNTTWENVECINCKISPMCDMPNGIDFIRIENE